MMTCPRCGTSQPDGSRCVVCGQSLLVAVNLRRWALWAAVVAVWVLVASLFIRWLLD